MLLDIVLLPEVFEEAGYSSSGACVLCLRTLSDILHAEAVIRDLRNGGWSRSMRKRASLCHLVTAEIIESLIKQNRLYLFPSALEVEPEQSAEWCYEALATHETLPLNVILCGSGVSEEFPEDALVQPLEKMHDCAWYKERKTSIRLKRKSEDYLTHLRLPLKWCNSVMFIDAHLDPSRKGYSEFYRILDLMRLREVRPRIELHRCTYIGSGPGRQMLKLRDVESMFSDVSEHLKGAGLSATIFVWDTLHDRYLITNQIGIHLGNGFDISSDPNELTTWSRLSTKDRDDIQREFDPASKRHQLRYNFDIGA